MTKAEEVAAAINKKLGEELVVMGSDLLDRNPVSWLSTGELAVDVAYGGGWVRNQWNEIVGLESSAKTALCLNAIAYHQAQDPDFLAMWVAAEDLDPDWTAGPMRVDMKRMVVVTTNVMQEAYEAVLQAVGSQSVDMVVIDSLPALSPAEEIEKAMDEFTVGRGALLTGQFLRKCTKALNRFDGGRACTCIFINQWRDRIGVTRGDPRTTPGGKAKNYFFWTRAELSRTDWITKSKERIGITTKLRTFKNKAAPAQREAEVDFYFDEGGSVPPGQFDTAKQTTDVALLYEVIERSGSRYDFRGEKLCIGRDALYTMMQDDPGLVERIYNDVMARARGEEPEPEPEPPKRGIKRRQS